MVVYYRLSLLAVWTVNSWLLREVKNANSRMPQTGPQSTPRRARLKDTGELFFDNTVPVVRRNIRIKICGCVSTDVFRMNGTLKKYSARIKKVGANMRMAVRNRFSTIG